MQVPLLLTLLTFVTVVTQSGLHSLCWDASRDASWWGPTQCILVDSETHNIDLGLGLGHLLYLHMFHQQVYKSGPIGIACRFQRKIHRTTKGTELGNKITNAVVILAFPELLPFTSSGFPAPTRIRTGSRVFWIEAG